ncbi:MAG: bifunctional diaminohydroxyphosphoribosylaminopyrimidine deaminase/5-amino-6-(5-phosphoribosylamino)uracil reductase RibD [Wenzhouxiangella sp.]|nr:MAG: bifunctional diaminohydroxyphosphoribosylaminopyrimidine deaminase/5-amino-6-(5-phosphoribosylamino)uracil reductase RibD [Wenzhouxiangella sp.]
MSLSFSALDHQYMAEALRLAARGLPSTDPNPRVGCVLVRERQIVGSGWHRAAGEPHAEALALREAGSRARDAVAYVTLEPCSHLGRTPPCADALIEAGVGEVIAAMPDPYPQVAGRGLARLRAAGIRVRSGLMESQARELNIGFVSRHQRGRPWVRIKLAASLDGRIAGPDGRSQWITSPEARADGQTWRARAGAILTGIGTVLSDDPRLTVRLTGADRQPLRMVLDSGARLPQSARMLEDGGPVKVASLCAPAWSGSGVEWRQLPAGEDGRVGLAGVMDWLTELEVNEVHVEAGPVLAAALVDGGWADELLLYQAPVLLGGGISLMTLPGMEKFDQRLHFQIIDQRRIGPDQRFLLRPKT